MKKVERQPDQKPAEPYAGGHDPERKPSPAPEKDKGQPPRRPEDRAGKPADRLTEPTSRHGGKDNLEDERSDRASSGRPLQLDEPGGYSQQPDRDRHPPEGNR